MRNRKEPMNPLHGKQMQFAIDVAQGKRLSEQSMHKGLDAFFGETWDADAPTARELPMILGEARLLIQRAAGGRATWQVKLPTISATMVPRQGSQPVVR